MWTKRAGRPAGSSLRLRDNRLNHRVGVAAAGIVALLDAASTIAVLVPEGNGGGVVCCGFEGDLADAVGGKAPFGFGQQPRACAKAAKARQDVDGDDVAPSVTVRGEE